MKTLWRIRSSYFTRPGTYTFKIDGEPMELTVDRDGVFEVAGEPPNGLGVFATRMGEKTLMVLDQTPNPPPSGRVH